MLLLKYFILFWSIFVLFSVISDGGAPIRDAEDGVQSILSKTLNAFADQADNIKGQADSAKDTIKDFKILPKK